MTGFVEQESSGRVNGAAVHKMPSSLPMGSEEEDELTFDSPQEEAAHYREKYRRILDMLDETRAELDEFQQSSKELEDELERELSATEKVQMKLKERITRLEGEKDEWKAKHIALQKLHSSTVSNMQREMDNLRSERDKTLVALRDLEMGNDELERNERVAVSSLLDLESKYNRAIEEKTLLEQDVVQRQELEEENQRLKDDVRDANNEIAILRDQIAKAAVPTPPSSVSISMSPTHEATRDLSNHEIPPLTRNDSLSRPDIVSHAVSTPEPPLRTSMYQLPRSNTSSSIPTMSPSIKRISMRPNDSPLAQSQLARSSTIRNLASQAASPASGSPARSRPGSIPPPAATTAKVDRNQMARTRGFKLLHDLQSKLGTAQTNLARAPKRLTSGNIPGISKRNVSTATIKPNKPERQDPAPAALDTNREAYSTPTDADKSGATFLSPNGWILVSDSEQTPPSNGLSLPAHLANRPEPNSPLVQSTNNFRSTSSASTSNKPLPSRPGIPSPLAGNLSRSATSSHLARSTKTPVNTRTPNPRMNTTTSTLSHRPASRTEERGDRRVSRPMSPSMLPQPTRSYLRSPTPTFGQTIGASTTSTTKTTPSALNRPTSRTAHRVLGRGPPPVATKQFPQSPGLSQSVIATPTGLRRSSRRSSLGASDAKVSGIPGPARTPSRPISMHTYDGTPPPVPRIPSAHKRNASRDELGASTRERTKSTTGRI